jgi:O-acetylserine/cysteine efflux transporter
MQASDLLQALLVVAIWGFNFVVIKWGVADVPPLLLGCLRFSLLFAGGALLVRRPRVPWRWLIAYGMTVGVGQFAGLFCAIKFGMPAGLASVVLQSQAFFTLFFARFMLGEHWRASQLTGLLLAASGLVLVGFAHGGNMTMIGFVLTLGAALSWGLSNVVVRLMVLRGHKIEPLGFVVWSGLVPPLPFLLLSLWLEGAAADWSALVHFSLSSLAAVAYLSFAASLLGYGIWSRLLARFPANQVAPFSLLAPLVALVASTLLLAEHLSAVQALGSVLLLCGLLVNVFGARLGRLVLRRA